jgi:hypothetical protein
MEYACQVWSPHIQKYIDILENVNRMAFRWTYNKKKNDHISDLMSQENWPTLATRRESADINLYHRIMTDKARVEKSLLSCKTRSVHNTRVGAIADQIRTNAQKYSFKHRINRMLNPAYNANDL